MTREEANAIQNMIDRLHRERLSASTSLSDPEFTGYSEALMDVSGALYSEEFWPKPEEEVKD